MLCSLIPLAAILSLVVTEHTGVYSSEKTIMTQRFRVTPQNVTTQEGANITLLCEVDHRAGRVQWTKDDYALGYMYPQVPGFPRYLMDVDESRGIFHLRITNVNLEDIGKFECQVGPFVNATARSEPIRAAAMLDVTSPPISVEMVGYANGARINVKYQQSVTLKCIAKGSRPCAKITWRKGNNTLVPDTISDELINSADKKCEVRSVISFSVSLSDDSVKYSCEASANTSTFRKPLITSLHFNVLYPPNEPYIEGYTEGMALHAGEEAKLFCRARGGNPLAELLWYNGSTVLQKTYNLYGDQYSENKLTLDVSGRDNEATYTCEATSPAMLIPLRKSITLSVYFGPDEIFMYANKVEKSETTAAVSCSTSSSNPTSVINWFVNGVSMDNVSTNAEIRGSYGGFITKSDIRFPIPANKSEVFVMCKAFNPQFSHQVTANRTISVLHAPSKPTITGYVRGGFLTAGSVHNLTCDSIGGNPLATLTWFKNNKKIPSITETDGLSATSVITVQVSASDNGVEYKCEATNSATKNLLQASIRLQVYFSPSNMTTTVTPNKLKTGTLARLNCNSSSSNPPAEISWWKNGLQITDGVEKSSYPAEYFGMCSQSTLTVSVTSDMNDDLFTCQATNGILKNSINSRIRLNVLHKPVFLALNQTNFEVTAGEIFSISLEAIGNPSVLNYKWSKQDASYVKHNSGPTLRILNVKPSDAGNYTCEAINSQGSAVISFTLIVKYSLTITGIPQFVMVKEGSSARLSCSVHGYPLETEHVRWFKMGSDDWYRRADYSFDNNTSYLTLNSVNETDVGNFYCIADNGIPPADNKSVHLLIEYAPIITTFSRKFAGELGSNAWFTCGASGAPKVDFYWTKENLKISTDPPKYNLTSYQETYQNYTSVLRINSITSSDYGYYTCVAKNVYGHANLTNQLTVISKPDPPTQLSGENLSGDSVKLNWTLNFDGGNPTSFQIRYYKSHSGNKYYRYEDTGQNTTHVITNLEPGLNYVFDVAAINKIGQSNYSEPFNITLRGGIKNSLAAFFDGEELILIIAAIVGLILILLNIFLILVFVVRRSKKCEKDMVSEHSSSSKSHSVELFSSSSLNGTVSRGTLSSHSEKSISSYEGVRSYRNNDINYRPYNNYANNNGYVIDAVNYSQNRENEHFILPHSRYSDVSGYQYNSLKRNIYENIHQNGYTSLNRPNQQSAGCNEAELWSSAPITLPLKRWEPTPSVTDSKESSPSLPPPMVTFNYDNVQERYLIV